MCLIVYSQIFSQFFGECTKAENIIIDKVIGESGASNSNSIDQSQTIESKFTHKTDSDGTEKVVCNYCKKEYFADTKGHGTTSMLTHINKCTKIPCNIDIKQSRLAFQPIIGQEEYRKALCRMVIIDDKVAQPCFHTSRTIQRVSLTTDTWTSIQRINYMERIINFYPITSHKGEDLGNSIRKCLHEWGLHRIFTVTVDNVGGTNLMGGIHLHIRCMAHIVNLIVQDGTKEANVSIERVREAVTYIRQSPARWKIFQECCEDENLAKKSLCLDVPTRWNSTYMMLSRVIEYEGAIVEYVDRDIGTLLSSDREAVKRITKFLEIFFNLTLKISGSQYQLISNEDQVLAKMAKNMKEKFEKYWGDPRHKFSTLDQMIKVDNFLQLGWILLFYVL
uniref:Uncharacterized protein n=1 Tax=Solanum lycopersicum TaxID=4081 RepID=A0A3Q7GK59_SOLLC